MALKWIKLDLLSYEECERSDHFIAPLVVAVIIILYLFIVIDLFCSSYLCGVTFLSIIKSRKSTDSAPEHHL